jgi:NAD(P)H-flavin reductase
MENNPYLPRGAVIQAVKQETYDTFTYTLSFKEPLEQRLYRFSPGQFNMVSLAGYGDIPISLSSDSADRDSFSHTIRIVGSVTRAISRKAAGDILGIRGPFGSFWPRKYLKNKDVLIIAGGIGLAPLRPLILYLIQKRKDFRRIELLYGARSKQDLLFHAEFDTWKQAGIDLLVTVDNVPEGSKWKGYIGVVTTLFDKIKALPPETIVLVCGPEIMMRFVVRGLLHLDFDEKQIYLSLERRMECGIGKCGRCQIGPKYVCLDGPVFSYAQVKNLPDLVV